MKQLECVKCGAPLFDPKGITCDRCRRDTLEKLRALQARLALELAEESKEWFARGEIP